MVEPVLPVLPSTLVFRVGEDRGAVWPPSGSAWRGAFGWALKRTVCAMRLRPCDGCMLQPSCLYPYLFETRPPDQAARMARYRAVPRPFALSLSDDTPGEPATEVRVHLTLFGDACRFVAYAIHAFQQAGANGLGARKTRFDLVEARSASPDAAHQPEPETAYYTAGGDCRPPPSFTPAPPPCPARARVVFTTPFRVKEAGDLVTPERFAARHLAASLVRRISMLMYFHTGTPLEADFRMLKAVAAAVPVADHRLGWRELTRRSARQQTTMQMGGLVGWADLDLRTAAPLWPYLWLGQWVQAGKGTTMGLGRYRLDLEDARDDRAPGPPP